MTDRTLSFQDHISSVCCAAFFEIRKISTIRSYLSEDATAKLVNASVTSRLDFCNSVLAGVPAEQIARLQRVQNHAARLILRKRKRDHVSPFLKQLHCLPVKYRWQYKIATYAFRHFSQWVSPSIPL